jgi:hypothetical protein
MAEKQVIRNLVSRKRGLERVINRKKLSRKETQVMNGELEEISFFLDRYRDDIGKISKRKIDDYIRGRKKSLHGSLGLKDTGSRNALDYISAQLRLENTRQDEGIVRIKSQEETKDRFFRLKSMLSRFHKKEFGEKSVIFKKKVFFSKKQVIFLFLILISLNILVRLPNFPHEYGVDSFFIHYHSQDIIEDGYAEWVQHPASLIGVYPINMSYPAFVPYLLAYLSQITGIGLELVILIQSIMLGVFGSITSFMFGKEFSKSDLVGFFCAFSFSLSPIFLKFTMWTTSSRALFVAFMPLVLYFLIRFENTRQWRYLLFFFLFAAVEAMTHRLFIFIVVFLIPSYVLAKLFIAIRNRISHLFVRQLYIYLFLMMLFLFFLQFSSISFFADQQYDYASGYFFDQAEDGTFERSSANPFLLFLNLVIDYASRLGIMSIFMLIGLFVLISKLKNLDFTFNDLFLLFFITIGITLFIKGKYINMFYLIIFSLLSGIGFDKLLIYLYHKKSFFAKAVPLLIVVVLTSSLVFTIFMFQHWLGVSVEEGKGVQYPWKQERTVSGFEYLQAVKGNHLIQVSENPLFFQFFSGAPSDAFLGTRIDYDDMEVELHFNLASKVPIHYTIKNPGQSKIDYGVNERWGLISADPKDYNLKGKIERLNLGYIYKNKENDVYGVWPLYSFLPAYYDKIYDNSKEAAWRIYG